MNVTGILDALTSHAATLGIFDRINTHEPKNAPGNRLSYSIWCDLIAPLPAGSGLRATTARVVFNGRLMTSMLAEPQDEIDPEVMRAVDLLMTNYSADFDLNGTVRNVDLLGAHGVGLSARAGYLTQDKKVYRTMVLTIPLIVNDAWEQTP